MFAVLAAAAVAQVYTAPVPVNRNLWYHYGDTPLQAYTFGTLTVGYALTIRPNGSVRDCRISVSSKYPNVDEYTCDLLAARASFAPAKAPDGTPMWGVFRGWMVWGREEGEDYNIRLLLGSVPGAIRLPVRVDVTFLVDTEGRPSSCSDENNDDDAALVEVACQQLGELMVTPAVRAEAGLAVPSVQDATVSFVRDTRR